MGEVPQGLPPFTPPTRNPAIWTQLAELVVPDLLLSVVEFVESISIGQTLAAKRYQRLEPDQELVALGASNLAAAFSGGLPVTGGFSRSVVNFDASAQTPAAGIYTAAGITVTTLLLTPMLHLLPQATLAATIIVAVLSLAALVLQASQSARSRPSRTIPAADCNMAVIPPPACRRDTANASSAASTAITIAGQQRAALRCGNLSSKS